MTASIDIAGAVAPAPSRPAKAGDARPDGATRSANSAGRTRSHGAHASRSAKAESAAADAFDAQLDAALPDADGAGKTKNKAAATDDAPQPAPAEHDSDEQARDQVATGAVLTPWTFVQPVEVTPAVAGDSVATSSSGDAHSRVEPADAATGTSDARLADARTTGDAGRDSSGGSGKVAPAIQTVPPAQPTIADSAAVPPGTGKVTGTGLTDVPAPTAAAEKDIAGDQVSAMPQASGVEERSTPNSGDVRDLTMAKPGAAAASSSPVPATAGATPARVASSVSTSDAEPSASTARTTTFDPSVASARSADVPVTGDAASAGVTAITAATPDQPSADVQAAAVAATVTPAATVPAHATRGDELSVKGRSAAAHPQQRHGLQATVSRDTEKGQRGAAVDASANVAAADDQRRNGSPADADMSGSKPAAVSAGSDIPPHEAPPPTSATRAVHPTVTAMPAIDGVRQVPVDRAPVAEASPAPAADVPDADTPHRLVQSLRMQFLRGGGDAIVQLRPEHLGQVTVSLRVEQGSVAARITAADPVVAEWLQAHQGSLRDGLQANGLTLERLSIDRDGRSPDRRERRQPPPRQRFRQAAETQSTFELTI